MNNYISCVAVDIINYDKPPASLAFLAGACEQAQQPYQCFSLNSAFLDEMSIDGYNEIYTKLKLGLMHELPDRAVGVIDNIIEQIKTSSTTTVVVSLFSFSAISLCMFLAYICIHNHTYIINTYII